MHHLKKETDHFVVVVVVLRESNLQACNRRPLAQREPCLTMTEQDTEERLVTIPLKGKTNFIRGWGPISSLSSGFNYTTKEETTNQQLFKDC